MDVLTCVCGGDDYEKLFAGVSHRNLPDYHYELHACRACNLVRTLPVPPQDIYAHGDDATAARIANEESYRTFARAIITDCRQYVKEGALLDIGCNIGLMVEEATHAGYEARGIDLDPEAVEYGRARGRNLTCGSVDELSKSDRLFDVILINHVLEHVLDLDTFIASIDRLVAPGGFVFINVPNYAGWVPHFMKGNWGALWPHQHVWQFTPETLVRTVERNSTLKLRSIATNTNLEPPSTRDLKGLVKQCVIGASVVAGRGDEIRSVFKRPR